MSDSKQPRANGQRVLLNEVTESGMTSIKIKTRYTSTRHYIRCDIYTTGVLEMTGETAGRNVRADGGASNSSFVHALLFNRSNYKNGSSTAFQAYELSLEIGMRE